MVVVDPTPILHQRPKFGQEEPARNLFKIRGEVPLLLRALVGEVRTKPSTDKGRAPGSPAVDLLEPRPLPNSTTAMVREL